MNCKETKSKCDSLPRFLCRPPRPCQVRPKTRPFQLQFNSVPVQFSWIPLMAVTCSASHPLTLSLPPSPSPLLSFPPPPRILLPLTTLTLPSYSLSLLLPILSLSPPLLLFCSCSSASASASYFLSSSLLLPSSSSRPLQLNLQQTPSSSPII